MKLVNKIGYDLLCSYDKFVNVFFYCVEDGCIVQVFGDYVEMVDGWVWVELGYVEKLDLYYCGFEIEIFKIDYVVGFLVDLNVFFVSFFEFFVDWFKVYLCYEGICYDVIDVVFVFGDDDFVWVIVWLWVFQVFFDIEDGVVFLVGFKCVFNIFKVEEKKDDVNYDGVLLDVYIVSLLEKVECDFVVVLFDVCLKVSVVLGDEDFIVVMVVLVMLWVLIDVFFDMVIVNVDDVGLCCN